MKIFVQTLALVFLFVITFPARGQKVESIYTDLATKKCKTLESNANEAGYYRGLCKGTSNYQLEVIEGDIRQTINVITPNKKKFELNLWTTVSSAFSYTGQKAEWRVARVNGKIVPIALIVRFNASENPEDSSKTTSYLVISKITKNEICVTDIVKPQVNANAEAVKLADKAKSKSCLSPQN
jgi:sulfur carrier protein ThiS